MNLKISSRITSRSEIELILFMKWLSASISFRTRSASSLARVAFSFSSCTLANRIAPLITPANCSPKKESSTNSSGCKEIGWMLNKSRVAIGLFCKNKGILTKDLCFKIFNKFFPDSVLISLTTSGMKIGFLLAKALE